MLITLKKIKVSIVICIINSVCQILIQLNFFIRKINYIMYQASFHYINPRINNYIFLGH